MVHGLLTDDFSTLCMLSVIIVISQLAGSQGKKTPLISSLGEALLKLFSLPACCIYCLFSLYYWDGSHLFCRLAPRVLLQSFPVKRIL